MLGCGLCRVHGNVSNVGILFKYHDRLLSTEDCRPHMHDFVCVWCITMTLVWFINETTVRVLNGGRIVQFQYITTIKGQLTNVLMSFILLLS